MGGALNLNEIMAHGSYFQTPDLRDGWDEYKTNPRCRRNIERLADIMNFENSKFEIWMGLGSSIWGTHHPNWNKKELWGGNLYHSAKSNPALAIESLTGIIPYTCEYKYLFSGLEQTPESREAFRRRCHRLLTEETPWYGTE